MSVAYASLLVVFAAVTGEHSTTRSLDDLRGLPPASLEARLRATSPEELIVLGREGLRRLGTYRARLLKQERVGGKVRPAQTLEVIVQPSPRAQRLEYLEGPKAGLVSTPNVPGCAWTPSWACR